MEIVNKTDIIDESGRRDRLTDHDFVIIMELIVTGMEELHGFQKPLRFIPVSFFRININVVAFFNPEKNDTAKDGRGGVAHESLQFIRQRTAGLIEIRQIQADKSKGVAGGQGAPDIVIQRGPVNGTDICIIGIGMEKIQHGHHGETERDDSERGLSVQPLSQIDHNGQYLGEEKAEDDPPEDPFPDVNEHGKVDHHKDEIPDRENAGAKEDLSLRADAKYLSGDRTVQIIQKKRNPEQANQNTRSLFFARTEMSDFRQIGDVECKNSKQCRMHGEPGNINRDSIRGLPRLHHCSVDDTGVRGSEERNQDPEEEPKASVPAHIRAENQNEHSPAQSNAGKVSYRGIGIHRNCNRQDSSSLSENI